MQVAIVVQYTAHKRRPWLVGQRAVIPLGRWRPGPANGVTNLWSGLAWFKAVYGVGLRPGWGAHLSSGSGLYSMRVLQLVLTR